MEESSYIHKSHNVTALIYHLVTPAKYRKVIFNRELDEYLCTICNGIEDRYEIRFLEIGTDDDHVHFLLQSVPMYSPTKIAQVIKSITAKKMFVKYPDLKEQLWGSEFWTKGYFMSTVGKHGDKSDPAFSACFQGFVTWWKTFFLSLSCFSVPRWGAP